MRNQSVDVLDGLSIWASEGMGLVGVELPRTQLPHSAKSCLAQHHETFLGAVH